MRVTCDPHLYHLSLASCNPSGCTMVCCPAQTTALLATAVLLSKVRSAKAPATNASLRAGERGACWDGVTGCFLQPFIIWYMMYTYIYIYVTYPQLWGSSDTHRYIQSNGCMKLIWVELDNAITLVVLNTSSFTEIHQFQTNSYALQPSCGWVFFLWLRSTECHTLNLWYSIPASRWCNEETWAVWNWKQQRNWHMIPGTSLTVMQSWVQNNIWFDYCYP